MGLGKGNNKRVNATVTKAAVKTKKYNPTLRKPLTKDEVESRAEFNKLPIHLRRAISMLKLNVNDGMVAGEDVEDGYGVVFNARHHYSPDYLAGAAFPYDLSFEELSDLLKDSKYAITYANLPGQDKYKAVVYCPTLKSVKADLTYWVGKNVRDDDEKSKVVSIINLTNGEYLDTKTLK